MPLGPWASSLKWTCKEISSILKIWTPSISIFLSLFFSLFRWMASSPCCLALQASTPWPLSALPDMWRDATQAKVRAELFEMSWQHMQEPSALFVSLPHCSSYLTEVCFWCKWSLITCCSPGNNYHLSMTISPLPTYYVNFRDILYFQLQVTLKNVLTIWKLHPAIAFFVSVAFSHVLWFVINPTYINLWDFFTCGLFNHQHLWCTWRTIHCCMQQNTSI